jgi:hypothetical protein
MNAVMSSACKLSRYCYTVCPKYMESVQNACYEQLQRSAVAFAVQLSCLQILLDTAAL